MASRLFPNFGAAEHHGVVYERRGIGATARSDGGRTLWVMMRPSTFLAIATPLPRPRPSLDWLSDRIAEGYSIAPPELEVLDGPVHAVVRHEGRHRATAVRAATNDASMPIQIHMRHEPRCFSLAAERLRASMRVQGGRSIATGPLFGEWEEDPEGRDRSGVPPAGSS